MGRDGSLRQGQCHFEELHRQKALVAQFLENPAGSRDLLKAPLIQGARQAIRQFNHDRRCRGLMLLSQQENEDIIQEAFVKALTAIMEGRWEGRARLETWTFTITYRLALDKCRHARVDPLARTLSLTGKEFETDGQPHNGVVSLEKLGNNASSPESMVEVHRLLEKMSPLEREIVERIADGYSPTAIAEELDREKQWGKMYPLKVQQILGKLRKKLLR